MRNCCVIWYRTRRFFLLRACKLWTNSKYFESLQRQMMVSGTVWRSLKFNKNLTDEGLLLLFLHTLREHQFLMWLRFQKNCCEMYMFKDCLGLRGPPNPSPNPTRTETKLSNFHFQLHYNSFHFRHLIFKIFWSRIISNKYLLYLDLIVKYAVGFSLL